MMNLLLIEALERARAVRPDLTDAQIARASKISHPTLSRAKGACSQSTFKRVLKGIFKATGLRLEVRLEESDPGPK